MMKLEVWNQVAQSIFKEILDELEAKLVGFAG